jgi:hypothetical protein
MVHGAQVSSRHGSEQRLVAEEWQPIIIARRRHAWAGWSWFAHSGSVNIAAVIAKPRGSVCAIFLRRLPGALIVPNPCHRLFLLMASFLIAMDDP